MLPVDSTATHGAVKEAMNIATWENTPEGRLILTRVNTKSAILDGLTIQAIATKALITRTISIAMRAKAPGHTHHIHGLPILASQQPLSARQFRLEVGMMLLKLVLRLVALAQQYKSQSLILVMVMTP